MSKMTLALVTPASVPLPPPGYATFFLDVADNKPKLKYSDSSVVFIDNSPTYQSFELEYSDVNAIADYKTEVLLGTMPAGSIIHRMFMYIEQPFLNPLDGISSVQLAISSKKDLKIVSEVVTEKSADGKMNLAIVELFDKGMELSNMQLAVDGAGLLQEIGHDAIPTELYCKVYVDVDPVAINDYDSTGVMPSSKEVSEITTLAGAGIGGAYWTFSDDTTDFYVWYQTGADSDPAPSGTGIQVDILATDTPEEVAYKTALTMRTIPNMMVTQKADIIRLVSFSNINLTDPTGGTASFSVNVILDGGSSIKNLLNLSSGKVKIIVQYSQLLK